jgi:hypothetical protein
VVIHVGGLVDISPLIGLLNKEERRWRTASNRPTLIYEYNETDIFKLPLQITSEPNVELRCSEDLWKYAKDEIIQISPSTYLRKVNDTTCLQVNTDTKHLGKYSLQLQVLSGLNVEKSMSAAIFTDLTKGITSIIALLHLLPAHCASVISYILLDVPVETVKRFASVMQLYCGTIKRWISGSTILECESSLSTYLNIFIPFMNAKEHNKEYKICGFKVIDMCLDNVENLQRKDSSGKDSAVTLPNFSKKNEGHEEVVKLLLQDSRVDPSSDSIFSTMNFGKFKNKLKKLLDKNVRKDIVLLLPVSHHDQKKMIEDSFELVIFLEKSGLVKKNDVTPLLKLVISAKKSSLSLILHLLIKYQYKPMLEELMATNKLEKFLENLFENDKKTQQSIAAMKELQEILKVMERGANSELLDHFDKLYTSFQQV